MRWLSNARAWFAKNWFAKKKIDSDVADQLNFHLEKEIELNLARGMTQQEARRHALISLGGLEQTREAVREQAGRLLLQNTLQDFRYALRMMRKAPGFTIIAVSILALGIGANSAIFSAVNAILFERWPVQKQNQLVVVKEPSPGNEGYLVSVPNFRDYQRQQSSFQQLALWLDKSINLTGEEHPDRLIGGFVSDNYFELLGVRAARGRTFLSGEDQPGAAPVAVLSYDAWQNRFGSDPHMLGRTLILNNEPYTVVGILPRGFALPGYPGEVFVTAQRDADYNELDRQNKRFLVFGRIKDNVNRSQATADLNTIAQTLARDYPRANTGIHIQLVGLQDLSNQRVRTPLLVLLAAVGLVLLIVCANIANLLLARGTGRHREVAVRAALGAARIRLIRQFLCESTVLATLGGMAGIGLAQILLRVLEGIAPVNVEVASAAGLDHRVLLFTAAVSIATGIVFGVAPALQFSRIDLSRALSSGNRSSGQLSRAWLRSGFVVFQVAISVVLVVSATLLIKSFHALIVADPGFAPDHLLSMEYRLPPNKYRTAEAQWNFHRQMLARVQQVPGVASASIIQALPFSGNWGQSNFRFPGQDSSDPHNGVSALFNGVTPEYFSTMRIPLLAGRFFNAHDDQGSAAVAIVSRSFVERYLPHMNPIGQEMDGFDSDPLNLSAEHGTVNHVTIVGVVGDSRQRTVREEMGPQIYFPYAQLSGTFGTLVLRTAIDPMSLADAVREAVWSIDKDQPVWKIRTVDSLIERDTGPDRFAMLLLSALSAFALLLSALGTYGMLSHVVSQRTRELGVRLALGASTGGVLQLVMMQGFKLLAIGAALGVAGAVISARLIQSLLYGVRPGDISAFALGLAAMVSVGLLAAYLPARRATRVDPLVALRYE